jgi:heme-degrading monooxygenase HmoA
MSGTGCVRVAAWAATRSRVGREVRAAGNGVRMHGRMARYTYTGDVQELAQKAEEGLLPIFQSQPGFKAYSVISSGDEIVSFSAWETAEQAGAANTAASEWVAENLGDDFELTETKIGEILFSTTLGVSTIVGAHA